MTGPAPGDEGWRQDGQLLGELVTLNTQISRYVFCCLDADAGRGEPVSVADEQALGTRLVELGEALHVRALRRAARGVGHRVVVDGEVTSQSADAPGQAMDNGP